MRWVDEFQSSFHLWQGSRMPKHHPYSRREFRRRLGVWLRRNLKLVVGVAMGCLGLVAVVTALLLATMAESSFRSWLLGALQIGMLAAYLHLVHTAFLAHDAEAIHHVRGAWGEDNTRDELQRAKRKKVIWGWTDSLTLQHGDIDHFVVTRNGGLVAIDSKWRSQANDTVDMARAAKKVQLRAEGLTRDLLKGNARGARRAKTNPLRVTPVVVLWGAAQHGVPEHASVDGIEFVAGRRFADWLAQLNGQPVDKAAAADILRSLEARRSIADKALYTSATNRTTQTR